MVDFTVTGMKNSSDHFDPSATSTDCPSLLDPLNVAIARLSDAELARMNREDLIDIVNYSVLDRLAIMGRARLDFIDDSQLKRLASLARFSCRRKVDSAFFERGLRCDFLDSL